MAAAAAANSVHWTVPHNLFRKPETQAHLQHSGSSEGITRTRVKGAVGSAQPEHGRDDLPGERDDAHPDEGERDGLQEVVELVVRESCRETETE